MFSADFISGSHDFMQNLTSCGVTLIYSDDACISAMVCDDCAHMCTQKPFGASLTIIKPNRCVNHQLNYLVPKH